ncbi:MAG TPA: SDR family NAD(P)-dependent oxidoreductase [Burkholderiales bacterium]|nr:SDR family NAD(P)-dependent oxidoreductase [Burkholderiales bacterium]
MGQLGGKTAFVAGAGRNNGKAIALAFAREGADVILVARERRAELDQVAKECRELGANVLPLLGDLGDYDQVDALVKQGLERFGKIDVLMSVAGRRAHQHFWQISVEEWHKTFAVNLHSTFYLAKAVAPSMMERKSGSIVALGGMASLTSQPMRAHVVASKTGLYGLIKALALELGPYGVRANLIALSGIENVRANPEWYPEKGGGSHSEEELAGVPLRRMGKPAEVANVAVFLASDQSSYVTGDRIVCAGGKYM